MIRTLSVAAAVLMSMLAAQAADLPSKTAEPEFEEPPPIPLFSWTGAYAGLQAGGEFGRDHLRLTPSPPGVGGITSAPAGVIGGAHAGYNQAVATALGTHDLVLGIEGDVDGADARRAAFADGRLFRTESDLKGSIRGRVGIAASRVLFFADGGISVADVGTQERAPGLAVPDVRATRTPVGYSVGAGVEYAFTNSYAVRAEYRASAYRPFGVPLDAAAPAGTVTRRDADSRLQAGISYRFGPLGSAATP